MRRILRIPPPQRLIVRARQERRSPRVVHPGPAHAQHAPVVASHHRAKARSEAHVHDPHQTVLARDGRWGEATPLLTKALRAEAAATSSAANDPKVQKAWDALAPLLDQPDVDAGRFQSALDAWSSAFVRKDLEGPAALNKKR